MIAFNSTFLVKLIVWVIKNFYLINYTHVLTIAFIKYMCTFIAVLRLFLTVAIF